MDDRWDRWSVYAFAFSLSFALVCIGLWFLGLLYRLLVQ